MLSPNFGAAGGSGEQTFSVMQMTDAASRLPISQDSGQRVCRRSGRWWVPASIAAPVVCGSHPPSRLAHAALALPRAIRHLTAHGDHHTGNAGAVHIGGQNPAHLVRGQMVVIDRRTAARLPVGCIQAIDFAKSRRSMASHVGNGRKPFVVRFGVCSTCFTVSFPDPAPAQWHRKSAKIFVALFP